MTFPAKCLQVLKRVVVLRSIFVMSVELFSFPAPLASKACLLPHEATVHSAPTRTIGDLGPTPLPRPAPLSRHRLANFPTPCRISRKTATPLLSCSPFLPSPRLTNLLSDLWPGAGTAPTVTLACL